MLSRRLAQLSDERHPVSAVDRDDCNGAGMANDLAFVSAPAFDVDADELSLENPS
jgi:hypothetical protein